MLELVRPASSSAASIDCGTQRTAKRKTSLPFIWMQEYDAFFGGNKEVPLLFEMKLLWSSLAGAFSCLR